MTKLLRYWYWGVLEILVLLLLLFLFFSTRPAANTTSYLYILEYTSVLMVFHRLGKPSALWASVGRV